VEVTASDIALANKLANEVLGRTLDELPPQTRALLETLYKWAGEQCVKRAIKRSDFRFARRDVRGLTGWGDTQLKVHLARLAELEYLIIHRSKSGFQYELAYNGEGTGGERFLMGLSEPARGYDAERSATAAAQSALGRNEVGAPSDGRRPVESHASGSNATTSDDDAAEAPKPLICAQSNAASSYLDCPGAGDAA
jgi:DNA primase